MTLFDMTAEFRKLLDVLDELDGEPTPEVLADLECIEGDIRNKADGYCSLIRHYESLFTVNANEASRLAKRAEEFGRKARWLKQRLHDALTRLGLSKLSTATNTVSVCTNGGVIPLNITVAPQDLPPEYRREEVIVRANNDAIRADLEAGVHVVGCGLGERGTHLRLK